MCLLDENRLFPADPHTRTIAKELFSDIESLPIISPHGHTNPRWFAENETFPNPAQLFVVPDHYVYRMLFSQGISLDALGVGRRDGKPVETDGRKIWRLFAKNFYLFRATPSQMWIEHALQEVFGITKHLNAENADAIYDHISEQLSQPEFRPRALFDRFGIAALATTESPLDDLRWHRQIARSGWHGRVITTYRPDAVVDPEFEGFQQNLELLGTMTGCDTAHYQGYLQAHRIRRAFFKEHGATATDHGHPTARTENLPVAEAAALYEKARTGRITPQEADAFRGQMLTEMARMSLDDGLIMQIHPGAYRNHSRAMMEVYGRDKGFDIPTRTDYVHALHPLLEAVGTNPELTVILFTLDETAYARELAPLAGVYPALRLGPAWWFFDSPEGMRRYRESVTETCGFYNTVGFNDDTRAFCSIPARHNVARRVDCSYLAGLVVTGRLNLDDAHEVAHDLAYRLAKQAYRL